MLTEALLDLLWDIIRETIKLLVRIYWNKMAFFANGKLNLLSNPVLIIYTSIKRVGREHKDKYRSLLNSIHNTLIKDAIF